MSLILCLHNLSENDRIFCHDYDPITLPEGSTCIHHSTDSETDIQWFFLKLNHALKSHSIRMF